MRMPAVRLTSPSKFLSTPAKIFIRVDLPVSRQEQDGGSMHEDKCEHERQPDSKGACMIMSVDLSGSLTSPTPSMPAKIFVSVNLPVGALAGG